MDLDAFNQFPDLPETHVLDNRIYTDQEIFEQEQNKVFKHTWLFVCHESELPKAGSFRTTLAGGKPIIIVRGKDGLIRSFYNICRHRSSPVVRSDSGNAKEFQCFYHLWTYNLEGACTGVTKPDGYKAVNLDKNKLGLIPIRADVIAGLVFVCLSGETEPLAEYLGEIIKPIMEPLSSQKLEVFHFHRADVQTNWKLWQDNNSERYHSMLHVINRKTLPWVKGKTSPMKLRLSNNGHSGYWSDGDAEVDYAAGGYSTVSKGVLPGLKENEMRVINLFPDTMVNIRSNVIRIDRMVPLSVGVTRVEWWGLGLKAISETARSERLKHHNMFWGPTGRNLGEDVIAVEEQWAAMKSEVVRYSILAREENLNPTDDANLRAYYKEWGRRTRRAPHAPFGPAVRDPN